MQKPITPTWSPALRRNTSSTAPLMSRAARSIFMAIIALPASSGSPGCTFCPWYRSGASATKPGGGEAVAHVLDVVDEAPPLLDHDDARARRRSRARPDSRRPSTRCSEIRSFHPCGTDRSSPSRPVSSPVTLSQPAADRKS